MTGRGAARSQPEPPAPDGVLERIKALRDQPKRAAMLAIAALAVLVLLGWAWANRGAETWVAVAPTSMRVAVGKSQQLTVSLMYKPHFRGRGAAHPIAGTIQLISFPEAVDVTPTTIVTTRDTPQASFKVTALHQGREELVLAASNQPAAAKSWQTTSLRVVVAP